MFMHKNGCEYYLTTLSIISDWIKINYKDSLNRLVKDSINLSSIHRQENGMTYDLTKTFYELNNHLTNSVLNIKSEENYATKFLGDIEKFKALGIRDPNKSKLQRCVDSIGKLEEDYVKLQLLVAETIQKCADEKCTINNVVDHITRIIENIRYIYQNSTAVANSLRTIISELQGIEALIKKEVDASTDFEKNLMSWM